MNCICTWCLKIMYLYWMFEKQIYLYLYSITRCICPNPGRDHTWGLVSPLHNTEIFRPLTHSSWCPHQDTKGLNTRDIFANDIFDNCSLNRHVLIIFTEINYILCLFRTMDWRTDANLYLPERQLTKASEPYSDDSCLNGEYLK